MRNLKLIYLRVILFLFICCNLNFTLSWANDVVALGPIGGGIIYPVVEPIPPLGIQDIDPNEYAESGDTNIFDYLRRLYLREYTSTCPCIMQTYNIDTNLLPSKMSCPDGVYYYPDTAYIECGWGNCDADYSINQQEEICASFEITPCDTNFYIQDLCPKGHYCSEFLRYVNKYPMDVSSLIRVIRRAGVPLASDDAQAYVDSMVSQGVPLDTCVAEPCPYGTYQDTRGQSGCLNCPDGQYTSVTGATSSSACKTCKPYSEVGTVVSTLYSFPDPDDFGTNFTKTESYNAGCRCKKGFKCSGDCPTLADMPVPPPPPLVTLPSDSSCVSCGYGYFKDFVNNSSACWHCPDSSYTLTENSVDLSNCHRCTNLMKPDKSGCDCVPGSYATVDTSLIQSDCDSFKEAGILELLGFNSYTECVDHFSDEATARSKGYALNCHQCARGFYSNKKNNGLNPVACTSCSKNKLAYTIGVGSVDSTKCISCPDYSRARGDTYGKSTTSTGELGLAGCNCEAGYVCDATTAFEYTRTRPPRLHGPGELLLSFCGSVAGIRDPKPCIEFLNDLTGQKDPFKAACMIGIDTECTACPYGTWSSSNKDGSNILTCNQCRETEYTDHQAATSSSDCLRCPSNTLPNPIFPPYMLFPLVRNNSGNACTCPAGWYRNPSYGSIPFIAGVPYIRLPRPIGAVAPLCVVCPENTYKEVKGDDIALCKNAPANATCPTGSDDVADCSCDEGFTKVPVGSSFKCVCDDCPAD